MDILNSAGIVSCDEKGFSEHKRDEHKSLAVALVTKPSVGLFSRIKTKIDNVKSYLPAYFQIASTIPRAVFGNPELISARLNGHVNYHLPHVSSGRLFGFLQFGAKEAALFTEAAKQTDYGVVTFYMGPFLTYYVTSLEMRGSLVLESKVGIITDLDHKIMRSFSKGNNVHGSFTDFLPIESQVYKDQRHFLFNNFHKCVNHRLYDILNTTDKFLKKYYEKYGQQTITLREFIIALVLCDSTLMLGIGSEYTLDQEYLTNPEFREVINHVAQYGVSESRNPDFEKKIYQSFLTILRNNYFNIYSSGVKDNNFIQAIFASLKPTTRFPSTFDDFMKLDDTDKRTIAMSFASIGLGGMVHSTVNTLDWAIARLFNDTDKLKELADLMTKYPDVDLSNASVFDKAKGVLFPIAEWVLHNVHLFPPFSHEIFLNRQGLQATLPSREMMTVPPMSLTIVNYLACNRSNKKMITLEEFSKTLSDELTIPRFVMNSETASFGGAKIFKNNHVTRKCPAANTSLHEQAIIIALILQKYLLKPTTSISLNVDQKAFPVCTRVNDGEIILQPRVQSPEGSPKNISIRPKK